FAGVKRQIRFEFALEERGDALTTVVQRRSKDMRRLLAGKLKNKFGQIAFDDFDSVGFQSMVEMNFFARHALALDDHFRGAPAANISYITAGIGCSVGDKYVPVVRAN